MSLLAFAVFPAPTPQDFGCILVYAFGRNQARMIGRDDFVWNDYIDIRARRAPKFDQYATGDQPYAVYSNEGFPEDNPFYDEET